MTKKQLERFIAKRNKSGFSSNLQFGIDADACGIKVADLGDVRKFLIDGFVGYEWHPVTKEGSQRLVEFGRRLYLQGHGDPDSLSMFKLMDKAEYIPLIED